MAAPTAADIKEERHGQGPTKIEQEIRKPKAEKPKTNASQPSQKPGAVKGLETIRNR